MNKKAEATISKVVYSIIIGLAAFSLFGYLTFNITGSYGNDNLPEYTVYEDYYNIQVETYAKDISQSQDEDEETNWWKPKLIENAENFIQDNIVVKTFTTLRIIPKSFNAAVGSIDSSIDSLGDKGYSFPPIFKTLIITLAGLSVILLLVKAYWERKI